MSTTDHVLAVAGELRAAWAWLTEATLPGRARRTQRLTSERAQARRDAEAATDRGLRTEQLRTGHVPGVPHAAPANLDALDARQDIAEQVDTAAWLMASAMRNDKYSTNYRPNGASADARFTTGLDWISLNAARLQNQTTINDTYRALHAANRQARQVTGEGPQRRPLAAECPACGRRSLYWDTSSTVYAEWHIGCGNPDCRCDGLDCACNLPDRQHDMTHIWLEAAWQRFADRLDGKPVTR